MNYELLVDNKLKKKFLKIKKKDKLHAEILKRKIKEILESPHRFKSLTGEMSGIKRVHIGKSFVLIYTILEDQKIVKLLDYNHHDKIYR